MSDLLRACMSGLRTDFVSAARDCILSHPSVFTDSARAEPGRETRCTLNPVPVGCLVNL